LKERPPPTRYRGQEAPPVVSGRNAPESIVSYRIRVTLPANAWMAALTRAHPSARVEILDRLEISSRLVLFEVQFPSTLEDGWSGELTRLPGVRSVELIRATPRTEAYRIVFGGRTFLPLAKRLRLLRRFPFPIQNGIATWLVVGSKSRTKRLFRSLRESRIAFELEAVRRGNRADPGTVLTPRQRDVLRRAVADGYFEVPRRVSLTELAMRIGVTPSTLSVTLAIIEKKLVEPHALWE
jgi:DNA-binding CsgD family transcriptional regulator